MYNVITLVTCLKLALARLYIARSILTASRTLDKRNKNTVGTTRVATARIPDIVNEKYSMWDYETVNVESTRGMCNVSVPRPRDSLCFGGGRRISKQNNLTMRLD